ncbi:MAG: serine/threonine protein kinase [Planctomycetota bacterium]|nr:MAG: serine/threonine protein kinase [Planctomycetota bacterium]
MSASDPSSPSRNFSEIASELKLLPPRALEELLLEANRKQTTPAQLALQKGLLDAVQVDIVETLLHPTETVPGYEILGVLGQGGMGVVYRARQLNLRRIVALKTVLVNQLGQQGALKRFEQEAQVVAQLAHPHIVAAYDFGRHEGRLYFAMELVTGEDVGKLIRRQKGLDEWTVWGIVHQAAAGLAHAAGQGIVHRDVKPANLLLVEPPTGFPLPLGLPMVKIADFGLAQLAASREDRTRLTADNTALGTLNYMSPEQLAGEPVDLRTDIFALGASAFQMLTGQPPQSGKTMPQIIAHRMSGQAESVGDVRANVSQGSVELVAAMMHYDPRKRLADYGELMHRIESLGLTAPGDLATAAFVPATTPIAETRSPVSTQPTAQVRKRPRLAWRWTAAGLAALLMIGLLVTLVPRGGSPGSRDLEPTGRIQPLFSGLDINQWKPVSGGWHQAKDHEGALVLQGSGLVRRAILGFDEEGQPKPLEHYELMLAVDPHQASAIEVQFDLAGRNRDEAFLFVRVDRDGSTLGRRTDAQTSPPTVIAHRAAGSAARHVIEIERQTAGWWIFVDDQFLGSAPFVHSTPAPEFRLLAEAGDARFSDLTLEELKPQH